MSEEKTETSKPAGFNSNITNLYRKYEGDGFRISLGDILSPLNFYSYKVVDIEGEKKGKLDDLIINFGIVMSQDCDLEQDFHNRGNPNIEIPNILICPAYVSTSFIIGDHIVGKEMRKFNTGEIGKIQKNSSENRYHYLKGDTLLGITDFVIDFKHFYTFEREYIYSIAPTAYIASINELYREHLSQRFCNYLSRIGLPNN